ncbi:MAG: DUF4352 domain-containing protein [Mycobacterium sp.]
MTTLSMGPRSTRTLPCMSPVLLRAGVTAAPADRGPTGSRQVGMRQVIQDGPLGFAAIDAFPLYDACCYGGDYVRAQGQFLYVVLDVTNLSRRARTFVADYQRLVDAGGRSYLPDLRTMSLTEGRFSRRFADLDPGSTAHCLLLFDVPEGSRETDYRLALHSSAKPSTASVQLARGQAGQAR